MIPAKNSPHHPLFFRFHTLLSFRVTKMPPFVPRNTRLCNNFERYGYCYRRDICNFAHGREQLVTYEQALGLWQRQQKRLLHQQPQPQPQQIQATNVPPRSNIVYTRCDKKPSVDIETPQTPPHTSPVKPVPKPNPKPSHPKTSNAIEKLEQKQQRNIPLYCGNCGSKQEWDFGKYLKPVKDKQQGGYLRSTTTDPRGVTQGLIRFTFRNSSKCTVCKKQIMRSPMSAVCVHCNALLGQDWRPQVWHCTNVDGHAPKRRFDTIPNPSTQPCKCVAEGSLHGAIAGRLLNVAPDETYLSYSKGGTGDCYGFVMVH